MASFVYTCVVNKSHSRSLSTAPLAVPTCCGKPMSQVQNPTSQVAPPQPVAGSAKAATSPAPTAQVAPPQPVAGSAKAATSPAPTAAQAQKPVTSGPSAQPAQKK